MNILKTVIFHNETKYVLEYKRISYLVQMFTREKLDKKYEILYKICNFYLHKYIQSCIYGDLNITPFYIFISKYK